MADFEYEPNDALIAAVTNSVQPAEGVEGSGGLTVGGPNRIIIAPRNTDIGNLRPKQRAAALHAIEQERILASHNAAQEAVSRAQLAVSATHSQYENAKILNELRQQAVQFGQAGGFLAEHSMLNPNSPDYYKQVNALAAKYPGADQNNLVKGIMANPKLREQAVMKGDLPGEVSTRNALQQGWIKESDLTGLTNQDGSFNHEGAARLADIRRGMAEEPPNVKVARTTLAEMNKLGTDLNDHEQAIRDNAVDTIYQFQQGQRAALGITAAPKLTTQSLFPRASMAPATAAQPTSFVPQKTSIPPAPPPPTPAPSVQALPEYKPLESVQ